MTILGDSKRNEAKFHIRPFNPSIDWSLDIAGAHLTIRKAQTQNTTFSDVLSSQKDLNNIEEFYLHRKGTFFIALCNEKLAGFAALKHLKNSPKVGEMKRLAVVEEFRRQGIGTRLSSAIIRWSLARNFDYLLLRTDVEEKATPIYENQGFTYVGYTRSSNDYEMALSLTGKPLEPLTRFSDLPDFSFQVLTGELQVSEGHTSKSSIQNELKSFNSRTSNFAF